MSESSTSMGEGSRISSRRPDNMRCQARELARAIGPPNANRLLALTVASGLDSLNYVRAALFVRHGLAEGVGGPGGKGDRHGLAVHGDG